MELTRKELSYLELYKGLEEGVDYLHPNVKEDFRWFYGIEYNYQSVNSFLSFIFSKDPALLKNVNVRYLDNVIDMVFTLSDVACRYALENPIMPYYLYRMENKNNLNNYGEGGMTTSFKSTSKSNSEIMVFQDDNSVGLTFDTEGFVPYIDVDKIVRTSVFSDEKEILFPPCVGGSFSGTEEDHHGIHFTGVKLSDEFSESDYFDPESSKQLYERTKNDFLKELEACRKTGEVSDDLRSCCSIMSSYIYSHLREMYHKYAEIYNKQNVEGFTK